MLVSSHDLVKLKVYQTQPRNLHELKQRITEDIHDTTRNVGESL